MNTPKSLRPPISPTEAARRLGLDQVADRPERVVKQMARRGDIVGVMVSKWLMIEPDSIDRYLGRTQSAKHPEDKNT